MYSVKRIVSATVHVPPAFPRTHAAVFPSARAVIAWMRASLDARLAARARELEAVRREALESADEIKAATDAHRAAGAEAMSLERHKAALIAAHAAEVADMVQGLKRLAASTAAYNAGIFSAISSVTAGL